MKNDRTDAQRDSARRRPRVADPDLELVAVPRDESFKVWSHGYQQLNAASKSGAPSPAPHHTAAIAVNR